MKKLLFLGSILLVAAACTQQIASNINSQSSNQIQQTIIAQVPVGAHITSVDVLPDSNFAHIAFAIVQNSKASVITENGSSDLYDEVIWGPYFQPTSQSAAYAQWGAYTGPAAAAYMARIGKDIYLIRDNKKIAEPYNDVDRYGAMMLKDGSVVFSGTINGKYYVHLRNKDYGPYDQLPQDAGFSISPDGNHVAWVVRINKKQVAVLDGVTQASYDFIAQLTFSPDSKSLGYLISPADLSQNNPQETLVVNGKEASTITTTELFSDGQSPAICKGSAGGYQFAFTSDGCAIFNTAGNKFSVIAVDPNLQPQEQKPPANDPFAKKYQSTFGYLPTPNGLTIFFASGGKYTAGTSTYYKYSFIVINGNEGPHFAQVFAPAILSTDQTKVTYGAYDETKGQFIRVTQTIK